MAEFVDICREWVRMCESFGDTCDGCSLESDDKYVCLSKVIKHPKLYERKIMEWAAEHPEPVYPTWIDWLMSESVIPTNYMAANSTDSGVRAGTFYVTSKAFQPIPADIAQKLGIEPKEG